MFASCSVEFNVSHDINIGSGSRQLLANDHTARAAMVDEASKFSGDSAKRRIDIYIPDHFVLFFFSCTGSVANRIGQKKNISHDGHLAPKRNLWNRIRIDGAEAIVLGL